MATRGLHIVKKWKKRGKIKIPSSLFIIYLHNELQTCRRSWKLLGCIWPPGGFKLSKNGEKKNKNNIFPVHNLLTKWMANLWKIVKSIKVQNFRNILICIWPPGCLEMSKYGKKQRKDVFTVFYSGNWPSCWFQSWERARKLAILLVSVGERAIFVFVPDERTVLVY